MDIITQYITLDFVNNNFISVNAKQYDKGTRQIIITCTDKGKKQKLSSSLHRCNVRMIKPNNMPVLDTATINDDGTVTVLLTEDMLVSAGLGKLELEVYDTENQKKLSTMSCNVNIEDSVYPDEMAISSPEFSALTKALLSIESAEEVMKKVETLEEEIEVAEENRAQAELDRDNAETSRDLAESQRVSAESARVVAENTRTEEFNALKSDIDSELTKLETANVEAIVGDDSYKVKVTNKDGETTTSANLLNSLSIGTVDTGEYDENPTATITGKFGEQKLNLRLPSGKPFKINGTYSSIAEMNADIDNIADYDFIMIHTGSVEDEDTGKLFMKESGGMSFLTDLSGVQGIQGVKGETGLTPKLTIGTVKTGEPGTEVSVTITGTAENPIINFVIPRGDVGKVENVYAGSIPYASESDENTIKDIIDDLQETVENAIIQTTDRTLYGSKEGGIKLIGIGGASEQRQYSGKNLIKPSSFEEEASGITVTPITEDGLLQYLLVNGTSTDARNITIGTCDIANGTTYKMNGGTENARLIINNGSSNYVDNASPKTFTAEVTATQNVNLYIPSGVTLSNVKVYPMIRLASIEDDTYEPYVGATQSPNPIYPQDIESVGDSGSLGIKAEGKNLFEATVKTALTLGGVTFTPSDNGIYTINGTATDNASHNIGYMDVKAGKTYRLVGCPSGGGTNTYRLWVTSETAFPLGSRLEDWGSGKTLTALADEKVSILIQCFVGTTVNNLVFKPMLVDADLFPDITYADYEPYRSKSITIPLSEPLRKGDEIAVVDGVWGIDRGRAKTVYDGSDDENWTNLTINTRFQILPPTNALSGGELLCNRALFTTVSASSMANNTIKITDYLYIKDERYTFVDDFKADLASSPMIVEYKLATPTFEPFTDQTPFYGLESFDTVTYISTDSEVEPSIELKFAKTEGDALSLKAIGDLEAHINDVDKHKGNTYKLQTSNSSFGEVNTTSSFDKKMSTHTIKLVDGDNNEVSTYEFDVIEDISLDYADALNKKGGMIRYTDQAKLNGIEAGANNYVHPASGVTAGTYRSVTVDESGHVTVGTNPILTIAQGGTGATTAASVLTNLGLTATATELNYMDGVTSEVQTQLNNKMSLDGGNMNIEAGLAFTDGCISLINSEGSLETVIEHGFIDIRSHDEGIIHTNTLYADMIASNYTTPYIDLTSTIVANNNKLYLGTTEKSPCIYGGNGNFSMYLNFYYGGDEVKGITFNANSLYQNGLVTMWVDVFPSVDNAHSFGLSSYRWKTIYAGTGTIQTSDRTKKTNIVNLDTTYAKKFVMGLKPSTYKFVDGTSDRTHWGLVSQDVEELMESLEMDSKDFAGFIKSPKQVMVEIEDENGEMTSELQEVEGEYDYSLRYDEFIAPLIKMVQMQQEEIDALKTEIETMKTSIESI